MTPNDIRCGDAAVRYMSVPRGLKHRPDGAIRVVPIPPVLVRMLRQHLFDSDEGHVIAVPRAWVPVFASLGQALGARSSPAFIPTGGGTKRSRFAMLTSPALRV